MFLLIIVIYVFAVSQMILNLIIIGDWSLWTSVGTFAKLFVYIFVLLCAGISALCVCVYVCVFIHTYTHTHTHIDSLGLSSTERTTTKTAFVYVLMEPVSNIITEKYYAEGQNQT